MGDFVMTRHGWLAPACRCTQGLVHPQCCYGMREQGIMHLPCCGGEVVDPAAAPVRMEPVEDTRSDLGYREDEDYTPEGDEWTPEMVASHDAWIASLGPEEQALLGAPRCPRCPHLAHPNYECRDSYNNPNSCGCDARAWEYQDGHTMSMCVHGREWHAACVSDDCTADHFAFAALEPMRDFALAGEVFGEPEPDECIHRQYGPNCNICGVDDIPQDPYGVYGSEQYAAMRLGEGEDYATEAEIRREEGWDDPGRDPANEMASDAEDEERGS